MLHHPTLDQLKELRLQGMADAFAEMQGKAQADELAHAEWLALLLDREAAERNHRRLQYRLRNARLRHSQATIEDVDYRTPRRLDRSMFQQLATGKWIAEKRNLIIIGPCGVGKSWLACALGQMACRQDRSVLYKRLSRLFAELQLGRGDGRYPRLFRALTRADLLILDDWGPDRLGPDERRDLLEIFDKLKGYVNATPDVDQVAMVVNGASELMVEIFGQEIGAHARTVAGVTVMPFDVAIEIEADFLIE